jgi:hypothetical protein
LSPSIEATSISPPLAKPSLFAIYNPIEKSDESVDRSADKTDDYRDTKFNEIPRDAEKQPVKPGPRHILKGISHTEKCSGGRARVGEEPEGSNAEKHSENEKTGDYSAGKAVREERNYRFANILEEPPNIERVKCVGELSFQGYSAEDFLFSQFSLLRTLYKRELYLD